MSKHIPFGVNCLFVYNEVIGDKIVCLVSIHTISGQPYYNKTLTLDEIMEYFVLDNWMIQAGS